MTTVKWVTASVLIVCGITWLSSDGMLSQNAFADSIPGVDGVQTMTWTDTYYIRMTSEDGKRTWNKLERRLYAYRHPGQYRETLLNEKNEPVAIHITDNRAGRMLNINLKDKKAVLKMPVYGRGERSPFAWVGDEIRERKNGESLRVKSISLQGQKEIDNIKANVVRVKIVSVDDQITRRQDIFFDASSKRLVGIWQPNEMDLELETVADPNTAAETGWSKMQPIAAMTHEIVLNPKLRAADFSLDPPADYTFEKIAKPTVTEDEMIAYLGAAARFNDNNFPDSPYQAFDRDKFNTASAKDPSTRTEVEQALIEVRDKILMREIYRSPVTQFEEDQTAPRSFHYVGSGVKVGQTDRIVAWYQPRNSAKYRAVFGDLSVKDVTDSELPLDVTK